MKTSRFCCCLMAGVVLASPSAQAARKPNIILLFADDISARELPVYGSSVWSDLQGKDTTDPALRAKTPVLDRLADEGCWVTTCWAATVCMPSRAMMMTGRYAHLHKWWVNKDIGEVRRENGKREKWPLYESSPMLIGHVARKAGYATFWGGKTQMAGDLRSFGFDEGCFTPGTLADKDNPYTDFKHVYKKKDGGRVPVNVDTGREENTYLQHGWYWYPHVRLMNHPSSKEGFCWWPNTPKSKETFGPQTYGPDVELEFAFEFMDRQHKQDKPFFIYHCSHLGHDAFDWLIPDSNCKWPGTPKVMWDGRGYARTEPKITGDKGVYDTHESITTPGIHHHIEYLDYQMWLYRKKLEDMGIADNTVIIFCADNGTSGYGKNSPEKQKGTHVPLIIHAPGMTKQGRQDVLVNLCDFLPTIADISGAKVANDYEINGVSLWPFLMTDRKDHRQWIYGYRGPMQLIRGKHVMKDGYDKWYDVSEMPDDLISFGPIKNWNKTLEIQREEREKLEKILPKFDLHATEHDAPGTPPGPKKPAKKKQKKKGKKKGASGSED